MPTITQQSQAQHNNHVVQILEIQCVRARTHWPICYYYRDNIRRTIKRNVLEFMNSI